jgi:hypothetical protein
MEAQATQSEECFICMENKDVFAPACEVCKKKVCLQCDVHIDRCPFCRHGAKPQTPLSVLDFVFIMTFYSQFVEDLLEN